MNILSILVVMISLVWTFLLASVSSFEFISHFSLAKEKMLFISWLTVVLMFVLVELDQRYQPQNRNMTVRIIQRNKLFSLFGSEGFEGFYTENDFKREKKDCHVSFLPRLMTQFSVFHFKKWDHFPLSMIRKTVFARFSISNTVK